MKGTLMRAALLALSLLALTACAVPEESASPGGGSVDVPASAAAPAVSKEPAPRPKPKVDNSANKTACSATRRAVGDKADVFSGAGDGTSLPSDVADASRELQEKFADTSTYAEGAVGVQMKALATAYGRIRVSITTGDNATLAQAVEAQNTGLAELGRLCDAIGA